MLDWRPSCRQDLSVNLDALSRHPFQAETLPDLLMRRLAHLLPVVWKKLNRGETFKNSVVRSFPAGQLECVFFLGIFL